MLPNFIDVYYLFTPTDGFFDFVLVFVLLFFFDDTDGLMFFTNILTVAYYYASVNCLNARLFVSGLFVYILN